MTFAVTVRDALDQFGAVEDVPVEEAQRTDTLVVPTVGDLLHVADEEQVLFNVGTPEPVRGAAEVSGEPGDHVDVDVLGARGHVADAQGLAHLRAERGGGGDHERSPFSEIESVDHPGDPPGRAGEYEPFASIAQPREARRVAASFNSGLQPTRPAAFLPRQFALPWRRGPRG